MPRVVPGVAPSHHGKIAKGRRAVMPRVMPGVVFKNKKRRDARALQKEELNRKRRDAYAAGRQLGRVTKCARTKQWHARFQFNRGGERTSTCGPPRASRDVAEQDRERIAAKMLLQPASSRMQAAEAAIECLREAEQE